MLHEPCFVPTCGNNIRDLPAKKGMWIYYQTCENAELFEWVWFCEEHKPEIDE